MWMSSFAFFALKTRLIYPKGAWLCKYSLTHVAAFKFFILLMLFKPVKKLAKINMAYAKHKWHYLMKVYLMEWHYLHLLFLCVKMKMMIMAHDEVYKRHVWSKHMYTMYMFSYVFSPSKPQVFDIQISLMLIKCI